MVELGSTAERQIAELRDFYERKDRPEAMRNLIAAVVRARDRIGLDPSTGLKAPRPYPMLAQEGERWIKEGRYWFVFSLTVPPVIVAVFFDQADLPRRR